MFVGCSLDLKNKAMMMPMVRMRPTWRERGLGKRRGERRDGVGWMMKKGQNRHAVE
jgi:hypothetical protein